MKAKTHTVIDQMGRCVEVPVSPRRIISLVPSQTELLASLGLEEEVVGITKFCVHPRRWYHSKTKIGGTKQLRMEVVERLQPDLIIGNKEENEKAQIEALEKRYPVWMSDIETIADALEMIEGVGALVGRHSESRQLREEIAAAWQKVHRRAAVLPHRRVLYLIWRKPYMAAGSNTFINEVLHFLGFENVCRQARYPAVELPMQAEPDWVLLSSEPYPFKEKHMDEVRRLCPKAKVVLVDGEMFSWYGSRMREAPAYFEQLVGHMLALSAAAR